MINKKFKAMFFSMIPGAGHMYLNLPKQGIQLMSLFFLSIFISNWLNLSFLGILAPIIWFYSFFDAGHKASLDFPLEDGTLEVLKGFNSNALFSKDLNKLIGYGLIVIGVIALVDRTMFPLLANLNLGNTFRNFIYSFREYLRTGVMSAVLIIFGIKLLSGNKVKTRE